jgi:hypothetical protein
MLAVGKGVEIMVSHVKCALLIYETGAAMQNFYVPEYRFDAHFIPFFSFCFSMLVYIAMSSSLVC